MKMGCINFFKLFYLHKSFLYWRDEIKVVEEKMINSKVFLTLCKSCKFYIGEKKKSSIFSPFIFPSNRLKICFLSPDHNKFLFIKTVGRKIFMFFDFWNKSKQLTEQKESDFKQSLKNKKSKNSPFLNVLYDPFWFREG